MKSRRAKAGGQLSVLSLAMVLGMAPWFAATAVAAAMTEELHLTGGEERWLTLAVQLGFVCGSLLSAATLLSDVFSARRLATASALLAGLATAGLVLFEVRARGAIALRFLTGVALAGVYPPGIKIAAGWTEKHRGLAIGLLVGALTVGSAVPHLFRILPLGQEWRGLQLLAATSALGSAVAFGWLVREGPHQAPSSPFDLRAIGTVLADRGVRLATGGYLGHMWELYAMWSSIAVFFGAMARSHAVPEVVVPLLAFATIAVGAVGCVLAGLWADRVGRTTVTIVAMAVSGSCALAIGAVARESFVLGALLALLWGIAVVADSAQFSACVTELAPKAYVGTAVTLQTALGFLLTMITISLVPSWAERWGWTWAYVPLAIGPALGIVAMWKLRLERRV